VAASTSQWRVAGQDDQDAWPQANAGNAQEVARLQQENERLRAQLAQAELIIGAQKSLHKPWSTR